MINLFYLLERDSVSSRTDIESKHFKLLLQNSSRKFYQLYWYNGYCQNMSHEMAIFSDLCCFL